MFWSLNCFQHFHYHHQMRLKCFKNFQHQKDLLRLQIQFPDFVPDDNFINEV